MGREVTVSIGKRTVMKDIDRIKNRIDSELPDPVLRLAKSKGKSKQPDLDKAYSDLDLIRPPFSMGVMTRLLDLDPYLAGAVDAIAYNVSACDMEVKWTGDGEGSTEERENLNKFFFESFDPSKPMSLQEKIRICTVDYVCLGSWNLEIVESGNKWIGIIHAPAEFVRVKTGDSGYTMVKNGEEADFALYGDKDREKDLHQLLRVINKKPGHRVYGKPLILSLVNTVLMNALRDDKNVDWFEQGVLADLLVLVEESIDKPIKDQIIADYQNTSDGTQTMYLLDGVGKSAVEQIKRELEGKSFEAMEDHNRQRVFTALRVPPAKVALYEHANRANTLTQDEVFYNEVVKPIQDTFKSRFDHLIRYGFGYKNWEFICKPLSLKDRKAEADIDRVYTDIGVHSVNEVKAKLNEPPVEGGDRRVINTPLGLVDLNTWEIAVAAGPVNQEAMARLAKQEGIDLVMRLLELRKELQRYGR